MTCKDSFPTYQAARKVARRQMDKAKRTSGKRVNNIEPYKCNACGTIHLTSHSEPKLKAA